MDFINKCDFIILDFIQEHFRCAFLDAVMPVLTKLGDAGLIWIAAAVILICFKKTRKTGVTVGMALLFGFIVGNMILKPIVARARPYDLNTAVELLIPRLNDYSFPSGHTLASFEAAGVLLICDRKRFGWAALALAVVIAFSRMYLYVHYPTDVFAAVILGLLFAFISYKTVNFIYKKYCHKIKDI